MHRTKFAISLFPSARAHTCCRTHSGIHRLSASYGTIFFPARGRLPTASSSMCDSFVISLESLRHNRSSLLSCQVISTIFFVDVRPEIILTLYSLASNCAASFFTSSVFALPRSGGDSIDIAISSPLTSMRLSELILTETEYCLDPAWILALENLLLVRSN